MKRFEQRVNEIVDRRIEMLLNGDIQCEGFMDGAKVNRLAEVYGGTYTEAWDAVRKEFKRRLKELAQ